jgi:hypothetical protein
MNITRWQQYTTVPSVSKFNHALNVFLTNLKYIIGFRKSGALLPRWLFASE